MFGSDKQIKTAPTSKNEADLPFLEAEPPHWASRGLAYFLIILFVVTATAAVVIRVPETVTGPFSLTPVSGTDPVRASHGGTVTEVRVAEGQAVAKASPLFVIRSDPIGDRSAELRTLRAQLSGADARATNERHQYESQRRADVQEEGRLQSRLANLTRTNELKKKQLTLSRELAERYRKGVDRGAVSSSEYTAPQLEADRLAVELEESEGEREGTQAALNKLLHEVAARRAEYQELKRSLAEATEEINIRIAALDKELTLSAGNELSVQAPCTGTVIRLKVNAPGAVVQSGDVLGELACSEQRLQGELTVPQSGVALIKPGQGVKLLYDAFPYQRYGVRYGTVRWVGPAGVDARDSTAFRALIDVDPKPVRIKGQPRPLMPGMGGKAHVLVGRRSLISYAFEPLRQLRESVSDVPKS